MNHRLLLLLVLPALLACVKKSESAQGQAPATRQNALPSDEERTLEEELVAEQRDLRLHLPPAAEPIIRSVIKLKAGDFKIPADALQEVTVENGIVIIQHNSSWSSELPVERCAR